MYPSILHPPSAYCSHSSFFVGVYQCWLSWVPALSIDACLATARPFILPRAAVAAILVLNILLWSLKNLGLNLFFSEFGRVNRYWPPLCLFSAPPYTIFLDCRLLDIKVVCYEGSELWMVDLEVCGLAVSSPTSSFISFRLLATCASSGGFCMLLAPYISTGLKVNCMNMK